MNTVETTVAKECTASSVQSRLAQAGRLYESGNYLECIRICSRILEIDGTDKEALRLTGNCCLKRGDVRGAIVVFHFGLQLQPDNTDFLMGFGNATALTGDIGTAQSMFLKAHNAAPDNAEIRRKYWDMRARDIDASLGQNTNDYAVLEEVIGKIAPASVLDAGCGSGRLFPLLARMKIPEIVGQDIAASALEIARARHPYPGIRLTDTPIVNLDFADGHFDLVISNRTLQHVTPDRIAVTLQAICRMGRHIYINELTDSDGVTASNWHVFKHPYTELFATFGFSVGKQGFFDNGGYLRNGERLPGRQQWILFSRTAP